jgi:hypothetical protein
MHAISRRMARLALGALALGGTACESDKGGPTGTASNISGTYTLRTVNARPVPMTLFQGGEAGSAVKVDVASGQVTLGANDTFEITTMLRETSNGSVDAPRHLAGSGSYTQNGSVLTLTDTDNDLSYTLTVQSDGSLLQTGTISGIPINARYSK